MADTPDLILIRHAETRQDPTRDSRAWVLTEAGYAACGRLADALHPLNLSCIVTSEETKARETGRVLAEALALPCDSEPGLEEHHRRGVPFMEPEAWRETLMRFFAEPDALVFGQETGAEARERFGLALARVLERCPGERLGVVGHATTMALFVAERNGLEPWALWQTLAMPDLLRLSLPDFRLLDQRLSDQWLSGQRRTN